MNNDFRHFGNIAADMIAQITRSGVIENLQVGIEDS
jgi:hypothetical protein